MIFSSIIPMLVNFICLFLKVGNSNAFPPPLSAKEEAEYFKRCKEGDQHAREILIEHNLRLVAHIIKKYYTSYKDQDDLISVGTIGLIKAIDTFDPTKNTRFATYAGKCLQNEILMYFRTQKRIQMETSINEAIETDKDGNPLTYLDIICTDDNIVETIDLKSQIERLYYLVEHELVPREREIIILRYGLYGHHGKTQREVAQKLGISRSYVSRLEKSALNKLGVHLNTPRNYI